LRLWRDAYWGRFYKLLQGNFYLLRKWGELEQEFMTTDERLDRLAERHGALAESLQLLTADVQGLTESKGP
jgi:predicted nuclease with TOPRIM domain